MANVTRFNFDELLPEILTAVEKCDFVAIDTEFTGLHFEADSHNSLFDSPQDRYKKLRQTASQFTISQLGLSAFIKDPVENKYIAHTYNIYLFPRSCSTLDARFSCQASSIQFLCQYNFDFNKFYYEGVGYMSLESKRELRKQAEEWPSILTSDLDDRLITQFTSVISKWLAGAQEGEQLSMAQVCDDLVSIQIQAILRDCFPTIWTSQVDTGELLVTKVSAERRVELLEAESPWAERLLDKLVGFTKVFSHIIDLKKPLVGHNFLTDLLFLYSKFYKPLPEKLSEFKSSIHKLLPDMFDTKHLVMSLRKELEEGGMSLGSTDLGSVHNALRKNASKTGPLHSPSVELAANASRYDREEFFHEAGFDAYLAGYVFLQMAHHVKVKETGVTPPQLLTFRKYLPSLAPYSNKTNIIRGSIPYVNLAGPDPASRRPKYLHVTSRGPAPLQAQELAAMFNVYNSVDIQMIDRKRALVATSTFGGSRDILRAFRKNSKIQVEFYNVFQHYKPVRYGLWGAIAVMGAACLWTLLGDQTKNNT